MLYVFLFFFKVIGLGLCMRKLASYTKMLKIVRNFKTSGIKKIDFLRSIFFYEITLKVRLILSPMGLVVLGI